MSEPAVLNHLISGADGAPPLLLGGSLGTNLAMWEPELSALEPTRRVIRFDHRGHGGSAIPSRPWEIADLGHDVLALIDSLGYERVAYAGVSLGGMVGMWLAANAPERVERLVVICSSARIEPPEVWAERARTVREAGSVTVVADAVIERWFTPEYARSSPEVMSWMLEMLRGCPAEGYAACCEVIERLDLRGELARIRTATLVVGAAEDPSTPPWHSEAIATAIPGARLVVLEHGAHLAAVERPDEVSSLILEHLA
ncbi:MAG TPA: 3-oxoadipate enol-lactonase [Solirubrobacteraceae bacterium]|jgi:3-oxoadipate enol-lactonase|nr:3-oxoadipate enol-lactonase [Solirubrobacteraceae bacterium]